MTSVWPVSTASYSQSRRFQMWILCSTEAATTCKLSRVICSIIILAWIFFTFVAEIK